MVSTLCERLMALERNVAALAEKVELMGEPVVQKVHPSMMVTGEAAQIPGRSLTQELLRKQMASAEAVDFGTMSGGFGSKATGKINGAMSAGAASVQGVSSSSRRVATQIASSLPTERINDAMNAGVAGVQGASSSSKRMATQIRSSLSGKLGSSGRRPPPPGSSGGGLA